MRSLFLACLVAVAGCAAAVDQSEPLGAPTVRARLTDHTFTGLIGNQRFFITFEHNGSATYYGADVQYVHWQAGAQGLCIRWYDATDDKCAPVYATGYDSYRVGTITMQQFGTLHQF